MEFELNEPFFALVALILFLALVVYLKVPRTITGALDKRADAIGSELEEARRLRTEAEALLAEYKRKAEGAQIEAAAIVDQARREAEAMTAETGKRLADYVTGRTRLAEQKIAQAEAQAIAEVRSLSADIAIAAAGRVLADKVKGDAASAMIDKSIGDVRTRLN